MEGYQESDVLFFFGVLAVIIVYFFLKNKKPASPADRSSNLKEQPVYALGTGQISSRMLMDEVKGIFVVVTSSDPQTQLMAMSLSSQILSKGKSLRVLLCGPGGDLALTNGREFILKPLNKSPQMLLKSLIQSGVKVEVCPFYMANKEAPATLINGVTTASPPLVADGLLEPGIKLFTF